jgi:hypothetical protein
VIDDVDKNKAKARWAQQLDKPTGKKMINNFFSFNSIVMIDQIEIKSEFGGK